MSAISTQQREIMTELRRREEDGRGAQSASDFEGFEVTSDYSAHKYRVGASVVGSVLRRLARRTPPLVEPVGSRPKTYRLTDAGREAIS